MTDIPWGALRSLTAREIISALIRDGFSLHNQRGSHQRYRHADGRRVTVTYHRPGDTFPMGYLAFHDRDTDPLKKAGVDLLIVVISWVIHIFCRLTAMLDGLTARDGMACSRGKAAPDSHTKLRLFADAAGRCQNPSCNEPLFVDAGQKNIHIAEMAHVFAAADDGPRANAELTEAERGSYNNLILLCPNCHTIIDKTPDEYPDEMILRWKRQHGERIAALFGAVEYPSRIQAREAIEPALAENRLVFDKYGPGNDYRYDPESELAATWQAKMLATILPNNRKIMSVLQVNRRHLNDDEKLTAARFQQHIADLEARHILGEPSAAAERFPPGMA